MQKKVINPWTWQDGRHYVQAVEVTKFEGILYCAGQAAVLPDGSSSDADMGTQLSIATGNLEKVISEAGYDIRNIARLTVYTTSHQEFFPHFEDFGKWISAKGIQAAATFMEVKSLYETLKVELEATVVK